MKVSRYWAREEGHGEDKKGFKYHLVSWSGSNSALEEAKEKALSKLRLWQQKLNQGELLGQYPYCSEIREELISEQYDTFGNLKAAVTRNRYGALVLNSSEVFFADVDLPAVEDQRGFFKRLFSIFEKKSSEPDLRDICFNRFNLFHENHPDITFRVYETAAGFRIVILNRLFDALGSESQELLKELGSDELYMKLCKNQECFRARLTPKPWRCDWFSPPNNYPRESIGEQDDYRTWLFQYDKKSKDYCVCRLIREYGQSGILDSVKAVLEVHDEYVLSSSVKPLA